jgi:YbbR domain-containing protein
VVWVIGPRSRLALIESVPLLPVDLSLVSGSTSMQVPVDTARMSGLQVQPDGVRLRLEVAERIDSEVSGVPIVLPEPLRANRALQVWPTTTTVMLRGARALVERPDAFDDLELIVQMDSAEVPLAGTEGEFPLSLVGVPTLLTGTARQGTAMVRNGGEPPP